MSALPEPLERYRVLLDAAAPTLPGQQTEWLAARRAQAMQQVVENGFPTRKDEAWRYTGLERVLEPDWDLPAGTVPPPGRQDIAPFALDDGAIARLVFANGRWLPALSDTTGLPAGVRIGSLREALEESPATVAAWLERSEALRISTFTALNTALLNDGLWLHIPAGVELDRPIELLHLACGEDTPTAMNMRNLIVLEDGAAVRLIEQYAGLGTAPSLTNSLTEIWLGPQARLEHIRLQDEAPSARHLGNVCLRQAAESQYRGLGVSLGGLWSRTEYHNGLRAEQARFELDGLFIAGDRQLSDFHLDITHAVPHCSSRERFKGIVLGHGRAVFDGRIRVEQDAQKTDAQLSNANLLLSRTAEIDTKPQLEIYADDVKCSHGTSVGQLDPQQLFYLRSRGIGPDEARRLLCQGFATEILQDWNIAALDARVDRRLAQLLTGSIDADSERH